MKVFGILFISLLLVSCSGDQMEELAFRKTMEYTLADMCGKDDAECIAAVKVQTKGCMEKSDWKRYVDNQDDEEEFNRFTKKFYSCIVDKNGNPYFVAKK